MSIRGFPPPTTPRTGARDLPPQVALAHRADLALGCALIRPSVRRVEGPDGAATVEPRVMQVLLGFTDAAGAVLSREDLLRRGWPGQIVGDDAINRAVAEVRRVARATGAGFTIETIARVGYRLVVEPQPAAVAAPETGLRDTVGVAAQDGGTRDVAVPVQVAAVAPGSSRRALLIGSACAGLVLAGTGAWFASQRRADPRVAQLIERGRQALRDDLPDPRQQGVGFFEEAVALEPRSADAWGGLARALTRTAEQSSPSGRSAAVRAAESAARRALALDGRNGDALLVLALLAPHFGDWVRAEDRLRSVLAVDRDHVGTHAALGTLLQSVGRTRDALAANLRALELDPLLPGELFRAAIKHWTLGQSAASELAIGRALQLFPRHPSVWNARLFLFAFTDRIEAASAMLDDRDARPPSLSEAAIARWRVSLQGLRTRAPADVAAARASNVAGAKQSAGYSVNAIMVLSMLGELDAAFEVARGYLLRQGSVIGNSWTGNGQLRVNDEHAPKTAMLFTPAAAAMHPDLRFAALCADLGIADYWKLRGIVPDYRRADLKAAPRR